MDKKEKATITMEIPKPYVNFAIIMHRGFLGYLVKIGRENAKEDLKRFNTKIQELEEMNYG